MSYVIDSIISGIEPTKIIRLGIRGQNNFQQIKAVFNKTADVYEILKSKKKILSLQSPFSISINSDRILYQRNYMKKLRDELGSRRTNYENDLIIKYITGTPVIVSENNPSNTRSKHFYN